MVPVCDLVEYATRFDSKSEATGQFLLAIPTQGENEQQTNDLCQQAACYDKNGDTIVGVAENPDVIVSLARELLALDRVRKLPSRIGWGFRGTARSVRTLCNRAGSA